jgi:hypothetical protein
MTSSSNTRLFVYPEDLLLGVATFVNDFKWKFRKLQQLLPQHVLLHLAFLHEPISARFGFFFLQHSHLSLFSRIEES